MQPVETMPFEWTWGWILRTAVKMVNKECAHDVISDHRDPRRAFLWLPQSTRYFTDLLLAGLGNIPSIVLFLRENSEEEGWLGEVQPSLLQLTLGPQLVFIFSLLYLSILNLPHPQLSPQSCLVVWLNLQSLGFWALSNHIFLRPGWFHVSSHSYSGAREYQEAPT